MTFRIYHQSFTVLSQESHTTPLRYVIKFITHPLTMSIDYFHQTQLINFLQKDLGISWDSITVALRQQEKSLGSLPMILWQLGLISLNQLDSTFTWLELN